MANETRDRLVELIKQAKQNTKNANCDIERNMLFADHLIENGVGITQWISVKDRLPEEHNEYLCAEYSKMFDRYFVRTSYFVKDLYEWDAFDFPNGKGKSGFYRSDSDWGSVLIDDVTHWMPLPEPPKAEQKLKEMRGGNDT